MEERGAKVRQAELARRASRSDERRPSRSDEWGTEPSDDKMQGFFL